MKRRLSLSVHPLFWIFAALIGFMMSGSLMGTVIWMVVILVSVIVHELGHALTAIAFGQSAHIRLMFFGGATYREREATSLPKEFLITLNGPVFGFALAGVAWGLQHVIAEPGLLAYALSSTLFVNIFWSIVNLFPIMPLDGGHLLRILFEGIFGARGTAYALMTSVVLGAGITVAAFIMGQLLMGAIFFLLSFESFRAWKSTRHVSESDRKPDLRRRYQEAEERMLRGNRDEALAQFEEVRRSAGAGILYTGATEMAAQILAERGEVQKAYTYLDEVKKHLSPETLPLYHRLAFRAGDFETAIKMGKETFQFTPDYHVAFVNALAHAAMRESAPAIGWLKCALREGMPNMADALNGREFDLIRDDPKFREFLDGVKA